MRAVKRTQRFFSILLCLVLLMGLLSACGKQDPVVETEGRKKAKPTVTAVPTATGVPNATDAPRPSTGVNPAAEGGFTFTGRNYEPDFIDAGLPIGLNKAIITVPGQNGTNVKGATIPVDGAFLLTTSAEVTVEEIQSSLHLLPAMAFNVKKQTATTFEIVPEEKLAAGSLYRLVIGDVKNPLSSFVFQTETEVFVKSLYPADESIGVPINTGIEMTLSEVIDPQCNISEYFTVSPAIRGEYQMYPDGKTVVFIPEDELQQNCAYTLTVKAGLPGISGRTLAKERSAEFRTMSDNSFGDRDVMFYFEEQQITFPTNELPELQFGVMYDYDLKLKLNPAKISIYAYASTSDCVEAMKKFEKEKANFIYTEDGYRYSTEGLSLVGEMDREIKVPESYATQSLKLPSLGEGSYLVNVSVSGACDGKEFTYETQVLLQMSDLSIYTESNNGTLLVWVNEINAGFAAGAKIDADCFNYSEFWNMEKNTAYTRRTVTTGTDGVACISMETDDAAFLLVEYNGKTCYVNVKGRPSVENSAYLSYVYSDRDVYFSDDKVEFFGILSPGNSSLTLPEKLYLSVMDSINRTPIEVAADGTFRGSFLIEDYAGYYMSYCLYDENDTCISSNYVSVTDEDKPLYKMNVTFDRIFYEQNDEIEITVTSTFYDGTPVPGQQISLSLNEFLNDSKLLVTDEDGTASVTVNTSVLSRSGTEPAWLYANAVLMGDEETSLSASATTMYFNSKRVFEVMRIVPDNDEDSYTEVRIHERDTSKLKTEDDLSYSVFPDNTIGKALNERVSVKLEQIEYLKIETGTNYDPISKTTRKTYRYEQKSTILKDYSATTKDGTLRLEHMDAKEGFEGYYRLIIEYTDPSTNQTCKTYSYAVTGKSTNYSRPQEQYQVRGTTGPFSLQDTVEYNLYYGTEKVTSAPVLYTVYADGLLQHFVAQDGSYSFPFTEEMMLGAQVFAAIRSGNSYTDLRTSRIEFDYMKNNLLNVAVEPEKDTYMPGDMANVTIRVTDSLGTPVAGRVVLSVVDEACFALGEQYIEPLSFFESSRNWWGIGRDERFMSVDHGYYSMLIGTADEFGGMDSMSGGMVNKAADMAPESRMEVTTAAGLADNGFSAGGGGAEEVVVREIFLDNPVFDIVEVGADGTAHMTIQVPDNITEWRLSAVSISNGGTDYGKVQLGSGVSGIIATLPFFVSAEICDTFLVGDDIVASARIYGSELAAGTKVSYVAELFDADDKLLKTVKETAAAGDQTWFAFGKLESGSYSVSVKAVTDKASDGVKLSFDVVTSGVMMEVRKDLDISELSSISPMMYPVRVAFYDDAYDGYLKAINSLFTGYSSRNDSRAAFFVAATCYGKLFGDDDCYQSDLDLIKSDFASSYGLLPILEFGEGDLALSAKVAALAPEALSESKKSDLINEFSGYLGSEEYSSAEDLTSALLGMAALGQPVLNELYYTAANSGKFSLTAKLYLMAAFAYIGDFAAASELYDSLASQYRKTGDGNEIYFEGTTTEESIEYTAYALMSAALFRKQDAEGMFKYLSTHHSTLNLYCLEKCAYVKFFYPMDAKNAAFTYQIGEKTEEIKLETGRIFSMILNKSDFASLKVLKADDTVKVRCSYLGSASEAAEGESALKDVTITKTIAVYDELKDIYKVTIGYTITTDKNHVFFTLSDFIPSGARFFEDYYEDSYSNNDDWRHYAYLYNSKQFMHGGVFVCNYRENRLSGLKPITVTGQVSYLIRGAVHGEFVIDSAVLQDRGTGSFAVSSSGKVKISDDKWEITK